MIIPRAVLLNNMRYKQKSINKCFFKTNVHISGLLTTFLSFIFYINTESVTINANKYKLKILSLPFYVTVLYFHENI